jgi:DNA-binding transcriptional LysR family regulator
MLLGSLRAFHEVVRAGSIRKAGDTMGISASSISRQVAVLERQMGTRLFERSASGVVLTHAGELVAAFARSVVLEFDALKADLDDMRGSRRRIIRLASVESIASGGPSAAIAAFKNRYEDISFRFSVMPAQHVVSAIKKDLYDIGITQNPPPDLQIESIASVAEPIVLAVGAGHPFAGRQKVSLAEVAGHELAVPDENFGVRAMLDDAFHREGLKPRPAMVSNSFELLRSYVSACNGVAVMPLRAVKDVSDGPHLIPVTIDGDAFAKGAIHIIAHRERRVPRIVQSFIATLVQHL